MRRILFAMLAALAVPVAALPVTPVLAQQTLSKLPPALKAAVMSGNAAAIQQAIVT